jgi:hypothetical protein
MLILNACSGHIEGATVNLHSLARSYFEAGGYKAHREAPGFLELVHPKAAKGRPARVVIWSDDTAFTAARELTTTERAERDKREEALLAAFRKEMAVALGAVGYYLVAGTRGLSATFVKTVPTVLQGGIRVPVQLFDADYKADSARGGKVRSVLGMILDQAARTRRAAQPFLIRRGLGPQDCAPGGADLVEHLETALRDPGRGARVRFIDGAAGSGKTVAFNALLRASFEEFREAKGAHVLRRRPIAFLPEHIRGEAIGYVDDVLDAAVDADMAQAVEPEQLRWLLKHGFSTWMLDGLDEFYAGDNDFFAFLEAELADPASQAQILICTRDSLLSSNAAMRGFLERQMTRGAAVEVYELAPWGPKAWEEIAWLELEQGRDGAKGSRKVAQFVSALQASPTLADLARLPFYCTVMLDAFKAGQGLPKDELELLQFIVDRMVEREHGKDLFRWRDFVDVEALADAINEATAGEQPGAGAPSGADTRAMLAEVLDGEGRGALFELIEALAHQHRRTPAAADAGALGVDDMRGFYGRVYASADLADPEVERLLTLLVQFAFFGPARQPGAIDFTHHILADYLAGRFAVRLLRAAVDRPAPAGTPSARSALADAARPMAAFRQAIGTAPYAAGSLFHRTIAREMAQDATLRALVHSLRGTDPDRPNVAVALKALAQ